MAVLGVVLNHAGVPWLPGGYVGVDIFFVISGYLITSHLLDSLKATGRIDFAGFYARRARRILPASFVVLALSIIGAFIWVPPLLREQVLKDAIATALYVPNYSFAQQGTDYLAESSPSLFQHYWSLGVEEQFYIVWPLLMLILWVALRRSNKWMLLVLAIVVAASFTACVLETYHSQPWAFFSLWTRAWELGCGGLVAFILSKRRAVLPRAAAVIAGWLGVGGIAASFVLFSAATAFPGAAAALPVVSTAVLILAGASQEQFGPLVVLRTRPFQFVGKISYSLYLVHWPILILTQAAIGYYTPLSVWASLALMVAAVPIAWLFYRFVEAPARRAPVLAKAKPRRTLLLAAAGSLVLAILASVAIAETDALPLNAGRTTASSVPTDPPVQTDFVPAGMHPTLQRAADDNPSIYAAGCEVGFAQTAPQPCVYGKSANQRIVLFGDSHAAQWYPALQPIAAGNGYQLETQTKSACASVNVELSLKGVPYTACDAWRTNVIKQLRSDPPALVVLANYTNPVFASTSDETGQWQSGLEDTIRQLSSFTKVVVIADTPDLRVSPTVCLSAHLTSADDCGRSASIALKSPGRAAEVKATTATGTKLVNLNGYFCTSTRCPAVIGDTLAYRDSHHVSATYSKELSPVLGKAITPLMADSPNESQTGQ